MRGHFDSSVVLPLGQNSDGDSQVPMIFMRSAFHDVLKDRDVAWYASEEREEVAAMRGRSYAAIDWTFIQRKYQYFCWIDFFPCILQKVREKEFLRPQESIAAGYFIYGPQTWLMLTCGMV